MKTESSILSTAAMHAATAEMQGMMMSMMMCSRRCRV